MLLAELARVTVMPATLVAALGAALFAMAHGAAVGVILPGVLFASILWVAWLERVLPYRADWNRARGDLLADALYLPTTSTVAALMRPLVVTAGVGLASLVSARFGVGLWPHDWPLALAGATPELLALQGITDAVVGLFQHANVDIRLGPLNYVFSAAPVHRWHHSRVRAEADHNYGDTFIFWDLVFGTYYRPREREVAALGIAGLEAFPREYLAQLTAPWHWQRIERESAAAGASGNG